MLPEIVDRFYALKKNDGNNLEYKVNSHTVKKKKLINGSLRIHRLSDGS